VQPLIPRFRSEVEPQFLHTTSCNQGLAGAVGARDEVPFRGRDPQRQQRVIGSEQSYDNMMQQRDDLEVVRILADQVRCGCVPARLRCRLHLHVINNDILFLTWTTQVRRREKLKRQIARNWLSHLREELGEVSQLYASQLELRGLKSALRKRPTPIVFSEEEPSHAKKPKHDTSHAMDAIFTEKCGCAWCRKVGNCVVCRQCSLGFCYSCFRSRPGHGVKGWAAAIRDPHYKCLQGCQPCAARTATVPVLTEEGPACVQHRASDAGRHGERAQGGDGEAVAVGDGHQTAPSSDSDPSLRSCSEQTGRCSGDSPCPKSISSGLARESLQRTTEASQSLGSAEAASEVIDLTDSPPGSVTQRGRQAKTTAAAARQGRGARSRELKSLLQEPMGAAHGAHAHATARQVLLSGRKTRRGTNNQA
jgi:hypothetical protein